MRRFTVAYAAWTVVCTVCVLVSMGNFWWTGTGSGPILGPFANGVRLSVYWGFVIAGAVVAGAAIAGGLLLVWRVVRRRGLLPFQPGHALLAVCAMGSAHAALSMWVYVPVTVATTVAYGCFVTAFLAWAAWVAQSQVWRLYFTVASSTMLVVTASLSVRASDDLSTSPWVQFVFAIWLICIGVSEFRNGTRSDLLHWVGVFVAVCSQGIEIGWAVLAWSVDGKIVGLLGY